MVEKPDTPTSQPEDELDDIEKQIRELKRKKQMLLESAQKA